MNITIHFLSLKTFVGTVIKRKGLPRRKSLLNECDELLMNVDLAVREIYFNDLLRVSTTCLMPSSSGLISRIFWAYSMAALLSFFT